MTPPDPLLDVAVCVVTFRRQEALARLLQSIQRLYVPTRCSVRVLVVDNDPGGSARQVAAASEGRLSVSYVSEPKPGIAAARNRAVATVHPCDLLAFLDDDMTVEPDWLVTMLHTLVRHHADMVNGVVEPVFEGSHSRWVDASLFTRRRHPTGTAIEHAATGGLLLTDEIAARIEPLFDDRFGLRGGEDTEMSQRAVGAGARIVFCEDAVAYEHTPAPRATARWVLRRAFRLGNTTAVCAVRAADGERARALARSHAWLGGVARILAGALGVLLALPARDRVLVTARCRRILQGAGLAAGALGWEFQEYRRGRRGHPLSPGTRGSGPPRADHRRQHPAAGMPGDRDDRLPRPEAVDQLQHLQRSSTVAGSQPAPGPGQHEL